MRMGRWKAVRLNVKSNPDAAIQLFDLAADPAETADVSAAHPEIVRLMAKRMEKEHAENKDFPFLKPRAGKNNRQPATE